jgi:hypothetical protein
MQRRAFLGLLVGAAVTPAAPISASQPAFVSGTVGLRFHRKAFYSVMAPLPGWPVLHGSEAILTATQAQDLVDAHLARVVAR